jgi:hypothetical protein
VSSKFIAHDIAPTQRALNTRTQYNTTAARNAAGDTHHASCITHHASRITHHTSRITHHTSRITHHTSRITHHTSRITHASHTHTLLITHHATSTLAQAHIIFSTCFHFNVALINLVEVNTNIHAKTHKKDQVYNAIPRSCINTGMCLYVEFLLFIYV